MARTKWENAFALASAHGHGWAYWGYPVDRDPNEVFGLPFEELAELWRAGGFRAPRTEQEAFYAFELFVQHNEVPLPGLQPALTHTTGTGRLRWWCTDKSTVLEVHRPWKDGSFCVLRATVKSHEKCTTIDAFFTSKRVIRIFESGSRPETVVCEAEGRHWSALNHALKALGFEP
jgi:hypothetical protein